MSIHPNSRLAHDASRPRIDLFPHQRRAWDAIMDSWDGGMRAVGASLATGTGKTILGGTLIRDHVEYHDKPSLWLVHRDSLVQQAVEDLAECGIEAAIEQGSSRALHAPLMGEPACVVATVQTLSKDSRLLQYARDHFGLVVVDEGHHAAGATDGKKALGWYGRILAYFDHTHALFLSATFDRLDGKEMVGSVIEKIVFTYEVDEAIRDGALVPITPRHIDTGIDLSELSTRGKGDFSEADLEAAMLPHAEGLANKLLDVSGGRATFAFMPGVKGSQALASAIRNILGVDHTSMPEWERPVARAIYGTMHPNKEKSDSIKKELMRAFKAGEFQYLVNCQIATEGTNVPHASHVSLMRSTKSRSLMSQMIGRGTRLHPASGKADCLVSDFACKVAKGTLCTPLDILEAPRKDPAIYRIALDLIKSGEETDLLEAVEKAKGKASEEKAKVEEEEKEKAERNRKELEIKAQRKEIKAQIRSIDPFESAVATFGLKVPAGSENERRKATPPMIEALKKFKVEADEDWGFSRAKIVLDACVERSKKLRANADAPGTATKGQIDTLVLYAKNISPESARKMSFNGASAIIDRLFASRGKRKTG